MNTILISLVSIFASVTLTFFVISFFYMIKASQPILEDAPESHQKKAGVATMGGIAFVMVTAIMSLFVVKVQSVNAIAIVGLLLFSFIGFADDSLKLIRKQNKGLSPSQKIILQVIASLVIAFLLHRQGSTYIKIPFVKSLLDLGYFYYPFVVVFFLAMTNSTNLTDGLDGLLSSVTLCVSVFVLYLAYSQAMQSLFLMCVVFMSALIGFLIFNKYPAKVIMGDTGSLAIGGFLGTLLLITATPLFILLAEIGRAHV